MSECRQTVPFRLAANSFLISVLEQFNDGSWDEACLMPVEYLNAIMNSKLPSALANHEWSVY